jgi:hypothetical protein
VVVTATLACSTRPITDATVRANVNRPGGGEATVLLHDDGILPDNVSGDGVFSGVLTDTAPGAYHFFLTEAEGVYDTKLYHRTAQTVFAVGSADAALCNSCADWPRDANGDGFLY